MSDQKQDLQSIFSALSFAAQKHRDQRRKDVEASPYINHPIDLVNVLVNEAEVTDPVVIVAAILHDTVEDTDTTFEELETVFGMPVADIVREVTDDKSLRKEKRKQQQIDNASSISYEAKLVKLADKICNLRDMRSSPPAGWDLERRREYFDWCKAVIDQMQGTHEQLEAILEQAYTYKPEQDSDC